MGKIASCCGYIYPDDDYWHEHNCLECGEKLVFEEGGINKEKKTYYFKNSNLNIKKEI